MSRQDHQYVNLPRTLVEVVEKCVSNIFSNGTQVYQNRKDFIIKSILQQIENEKTKDSTLARKVSPLELKNSINNKTANRTRGGNRPKNV